MKQMPQYKIYIGQDNKYHWHLKGDNGEIVCWSEGYNTFQGAVNSANWVKLYAPNSPIVK